MPIPSALSTLHRLSIITLLILSLQATPQICWPAAPPNPVSTQFFGSNPFDRVIESTAYAIFSFATYIKDQAIYQIVNQAPFLSLIQTRNFSKLFRTAYLSRGWSLVGPKILGKSAVTSRPSIRLASVTLRNPLLRQATGPGLEPEDSGPTLNKPSQKQSLEPPPAATVLISSFGTANFLPSNSAQNQYQNWPQNLDTSVDVPPMSNPMTGFFQRLKRDSQINLAQAIIPPAGPESSALEAENSEGLTREPSLCMNATQRFE